MNKLENIKVGDQVIVAVNEDRFYEQVTGVTISGVIVRYGYFRGEDGCFYSGNRVDKNRFIVINPTQEDYEKAGKTA